MEKRFNIVGRPFARGNASHGIPVAYLVGRDRLPLDIRRPALAIRPSSNRTLAPSRVVRRDGARSPLSHTSRRRIIDVNKGPCPGRRLHNIEEGRGRVGRPFL